MKNQVLLPTPILSSLDLTILALSPGKGFNSSLGSYFLPEVLSVDSDRASPSPPPSSALSLLAASCSSFWSRSSSNAIRSSGVIVMAVGLRRSIFLVCKNSIDIEGIDKKTICVEMINYGR